MNLENLEVGMIVKNYKVMCELLGEDVQAGNSKKSQLKEWDRYFKYNKSGNKFVIIKIYEKPIEKEDLRGKSSIYGELAQLLIVDMLMKNKEKHVSMSKSMMIESIGIANRNYSDCKENMIKLANFLNIGIEYIYDFYNINNSNFTSIIETALKNLSDKRIIMYDIIHKAKPSDSNTYRKLTMTEMEFIINTERGLLDKYSYETISSIRKSKDWIKFRKDVMDILKEALNIDYYYRAYDIAINTEYIGKEKDYLINKIKDVHERDNKKKELNDLVLHNILKNAEKRHSQENTSKNFRNNENYITNTETLSNALVKRSSGSIIDSVRKQSPSYSKPKSELQLQYEALFEDEVSELLPF